MCDQSFTPQNEHKYCGDNDLRAEQHIPKLDVGGSNPLARYLLLPQALTRLEARRHETGFDPLVNTNPRLRLRNRDK